VLGLLGMGILPAVVRLIKEDAPPGMDARTLALGAALQMLGNGGGPFLAGLIAPRWGMRTFFLLNTGLIALVLALWGRRGLRAGERSRP